MRPNPSRARRATWLVAGIVLAAVGLAAVAAAISAPPPGGPQASPGVTPSGDPSTGLGLGDVAELEDGAVARLNGVATGVLPLPGSPGPEPGLRLDRLDVEVCAGGADLFVDAAFWNGLGADRRVHSAHLGVRSFQTLALGPGSCQRGGVELAIPEAVELAEVLLLDLELTTAARWAVDGEAEVLGPLASAVDPIDAAVGSTVELGVGGSATVLAVDLDAAPSSSGPAPSAGRLARVEAELCAGPEPFPTSPRHWLLGLADQRLLPADAGGWSAGAGTLAAGTCDRGFLDFAVPDGAEPVGVRYAYGGQFEQARWALGG